MNDFSLSLHYHENLQYYKERFEYLQNYENYDSSLTLISSEFNDNYSKLKSKLFSNEEFNPAEFKTLETLIIEYNKKMILSWISSLKLKIENRTTKGQLFNDLIKRLDEICKNSLSYKYMDEFTILNGDLDDITKEINDRISLEEHFNKQNWRFTLINIAAGAVIGFIISMLTGFILKIWVS
jgi:tetrahydromethanopterin S-methyltransferase subunit G